MSDEEYKLVVSKTPIPTVDLVILRREKNKAEVLLLVRETGYQKGNWCLIGGRQRIGETLSDTIKRQAKELNIEVEIIAPFTSNFPLWVNDKLGQDKTKQSLTHIYPVKIKSGKVRREGKEYSGFRWFTLEKIPKIVFDQNFEVTKTIEQLKKISKNFKL